jgi:hypothetical protein
MASTTLVLGALLVSMAGGQESKAPAGVAGVWIILLEGHQVGLGLEQDGSKVTGTLQIMGKNVPVDGEFVESKLTLSGEAGVGAHGDQQTVPLKITATLKDDGTLEGEMNTARGPMRWTAERMKPRK